MTATSTPHAASPAELLERLVARADGLAPAQLARELVAALEEVRQLLTPQNPQPGPASDDTAAAAADNIRPTLDRQARKLRDELGGLIGQAAALAEQADAESHESRPDAATIKQMAGELAAAVRHHQEATAELVFDSVNTDLGSGD